MQREDGFNDGYRIFINSLPLLPSLFELGVYLYFFPDLFADLFEDFFRPWPPVFFPPEV